jgi:hypothetical protein
MLAQMRVKITALFARLQRQQSPRRDRHDQNDADQLGTDEPARRARRIRLGGALPPLAYRPFTPEIFSSRRRCGPFRFFLI